MHLHHGNTNFPKNLELINQRIYHIHKQLTYWDLYKITTAVNSSTQLETTVAALAPGEACIINTNTFSDGKDTFSRGDVIVKTIDNELVVVKTINSGLYYPARIKTDGDAYSLSYAFSASAPETSVPSVVPVDSPKAAELSQEITFTGLHGATTDGYIYGEFQEVQLDAQSQIPTLTVKYATIDTNAQPTPSDPSDDVLVYPVIKFFRPTGNYFEEIVGDFEVTGNNTSRQWEIKPTFYEAILGTLYMQVK